jgi:hypothetical protein
MIRIPRIASALLLAAVVTTVVAPLVQAHAPSPVFVGADLYAQDLDLTFDWSDEQMPIQAFRDAVKAGAADSNATRGSRAPTFRAKDGATNQVAYGTDVVCGIGGIACMRRDPPGWFGMWFREQGHWFDWGSLKWCQHFATWPNGCFDVENITLDELGHILILDHHENYSDGRDYTDSVVQTVSRAKPATAWNAHGFGRCDVAQLQRQYDVLSTTKISTCLDIPTSVALTPSVSTTPYDGSVRFTAHLEVLNDPSVTFRLRGNDLDGRVVVLQRRPIGGAWTDVQTLPGAGSSGSYAVTLRLRSTADWRAVFRKPIDEGLRAITGSPVRVTVTGGCTGSPCPLSVPVAGGTR